MNDVDRACDAIADVVLAELDAWPRDYDLPHIEHEEC